MYGVTQLSVTEDISLITFPRVSADLAFVTEVFELLEEERINIDMISQTAAQGLTCGLSFTVSGHLVTSTLEAIGRSAHAHAELKPMVSEGYAKLSLYGEAMREQPGVAARAMRALLDGGVEIRMITTSEVDISVLIADIDLPDAVEALETAFALPTTQR